MKYSFIYKVLALTLTAALTLQLGSPVLAAEETVPGDSPAYLEENPPDEDLTGDVIDPDEGIPDEPEPVSAVVGAFHMPDEYKEEYDAMFWAKASGISNNGGKYGSSVIGNLIDGDVKTHWETGKPNTDSFQNSVTVTFEKSVELGSVVYYPRTKGAANKGFPTAFSIYASRKASGEDFKLVCSGSAPIASGGTQISFEPHKFTRLRFVFDTAHQNWASGGELSFYRPDPLVSQVDSLFTDGTMSALKKEYQNMEILNEMLKKAEANPNKELMEKIQTAIEIQTGQADYTSSVMTLEQRGNGVNHARKVLKTSSYGSNLLPAGYAARPGDVVKFYVQADEGAPMPSVVFTQQIGRYGSWQKSYALKNGENIITAPKIFSEKWSTKTYPGGAIYFTNPYTQKEQGSAPRIRIEGGIDYPLFKDGDDVEAFKRELAAYKASVEADRPNSVDIVEVYSDLFILNGNLKAAEPFLNGTGDPQRTVDLHNARVGEMLAFAGIDESSFEHSRNGARLNMRLMQPFGAGYAAGDHVGIQQGSANTFFKGELVGWIYTHEVGHQLDMMGGKVPEVTNNMWANHIAVDVQNENDRVNYQNILLYLGRDDYKTLDVKPHTLGMWWQLHLLDENYWPSYQKAFRENIAGDMGLTDRERMAVISSYVLGMDLIEHFERYGFITRSKAVDKALKALKVEKAPENIKPWYLWTKASKDRTSAFDKAYTPDIISVERRDNKLQIAMGIDGAADSALLGFEVMEDGAVIGFTKTDSFATSYFADDGKEHVYTVRAYDLRMNQSQVSEPVSVSLDAPVIKVTGGTLTAIHEDFDPLSVVSAYDKDGADISDAIQVIKSNVNTSVRGEYSVTYEAADQAGMVSRLTVPVTVVSAFVYASDIEEQSAVVGWSTLKKDKNISGGTITLLKNQKPVTFEKGLGAHATSKIVYDVAGKGYTQFEAYVGIDQSVKNSKAPNAVFQVFVDGEKRFDSGAVKVADNMKYALVDIQGASTVELVADSNGANSSDHTVWAGARFAVLSSAPVIHAQDVSFTDPSQVDLNTVVSDVTAFDAEDGDLTGDITYATDYISGKTGAFTITYSVTDSDGNTTQLTKNLVVVNSFVYVSDQEWKSASTGYGTIQRDKAIDGKTLKLADGDGERTYDKGLGVHAHSEIVYDLTGRNFYYFTSDVGVSAASANANTSVAFKVYVDGELAAETPVMYRGTPYEHLAVSLAGASTLKLVVTNGGNGIANDHANWADAKFLIAVEEVDKTSLESAVSQAGELEEGHYTAGSWQALMTVLEQAEKVLLKPSASQEEVAAALEALTEAVNSLERLVDTSQLEELIELALSVAEIENVSPINDKHQEIFVENLIAACADAQAALQNPDITQEDADYWYQVVRYFLWDMNPEYTPGWEPLPSEPETGEISQ